MMSNARFLDQSNESNVSGGIGQKLLTKMGWKSGDGLGKHNQGMANLNTLWKYRRSADCKKGVMCKEERPPFEILPHQNAFEDLLNNLNSEISENSELSSKPVQTPSREKTSKRPVRYLKMARAKDVKNYSVTDFKGIIGKEVVKRSLNSCDSSTNESSLGFEETIVHDSCELHLNDNEQNITHEEKDSTKELDDQFQISGKCKLLENSVDIEVPEEKIELTFEIRKLKRKRKQERLACENTYISAELESQLPVFQEKDTLESRSNVRYEEQRKQFSKTRKQQRTSRKEQILECENKFSYEESQEQLPSHQGNSVQLEGSTLNTHEEQSPSKAFNGSKRRNEKRQKNLFSYCDTGSKIEWENNEVREKTNIDSPFEMESNGMSSGKKKRKGKNKISKGNAPYTDSTNLEAGSALKKKRNMFLGINVCASNHNNDSEMQNLNHTEVSDNKCEDSSDKLPKNVDQVRKYNSTDVFRINSFSFDREKIVKRYLDEHPELLQEIANGFAGSNILSIQGYGN